MVVPSPSQDADEEHRPRDEEEKEDVGECLEDKDVSGIKESEDNPFKNAWINGVSNGRHHPRNDECTEVNVTKTTPNKFLVNKTPTEARTKKILQNFKRLNIHFINYDDYDEDELNRYFWEHVSYFFARRTNLAKANSCNRWQTN